MPDELFDPVAADYDSWYETELGRMVDRVERELVEKMFQPVGNIVLEVGCGTGQYTTWLTEQGFKVTAVDISEAMMARAQAKIAALGYQVEWRQGDIATILPELGRFHGIFSLTAFEFIPSLEKVLQDLYEHLEPGGCMVIGVIAGESTWSELYMKAARDKQESVFAHASFYTEEEIMGWQVGGRIELGKALYFPPNVEMMEKARELETEKAGRPGFLVAKWVKE